MCSVNRSAAPAHESANAQVAARLNKTMLEIEYSTLFSGAVNASAMNNIGLLISTARTTIHGSVGIMAIIAVSTYSMAIRQTGPPGAGRCSRRALAIRPEALAASGRLMNSM